MVVLTGAAIAALAWVMEAQSECRAGLAEIEERFRLVQVSHALSPAADVWSIDRAQIDSMLDGIRQLPDVVSVGVVGERPCTGAELTRRREGPAGSTLERRVDLVYEEGGGRHTVAQLLPSPRSAGLTKRCGRCCGTSSLWVRAAALGLTNGRSRW